MGNDIEGFFRKPKDQTILTQRECEVAMLISEGWSNEVIAKKLWVTTKTVNAHIFHIYEKLRAEFNCEGRNMRAYLVSLYKERSNGQVQ